MRVAHASAPATFRVGVSRRRDHQRVWRYPIGDAVGSNPANSLLESLETHSLIATGTHGAMKALFDGPVQQREVVCMNLYKRVFPKWPEDNDLSFAAA
jgi:hypothetical protein